MSGLRLFSAPSRRPRGPYRGARGGRSARPYEDDGNGFRTERDSSGRAFRPRHVEVLRAAHRRRPRRRLGARDHRGRRDEREEVVRPRKARLRGQAGARLRHGAALRPRGAHAGLVRLGVRNRRDFVDTSGLDRSRRRGAVRSRAGHPVLLPVPPGHESGRGELKPGPFLVRRVTLTARSVTPIHRGGALIIGSSFRRKVRRRRSSCRVSLREGRGLRFSRSASLQEGIVSLQEGIASLQEEPRRRSFRSASSRERIGSLQEEPLRLSSLQRLLSRRNWLLARGVTTSWVLAEDPPARASAGTLQLSSELADECEPAPLSDSCVRSGVSS
jgi:hypothetical protein